MKVFVSEVLFTPRDCAVIALVRGNLRSSVVHRALLSADLPPAFGPRCVSGDTPTPRMRGIPPLLAASFVARSAARRSELRLDARRE